MPVLILGKGKPSREDPWCVGREGDIAPGRKEESWGVGCPTQKLLGGSVLRPSSERFHPISPVSMGERTRIPVLLTSATSQPRPRPHHLLSEKGRLHPHTECVGMGTRGMGHGLREIDQQA